MKKNKNKNAIVMLVARVNIIFNTLSYFYKNWNDKYKYPIYIHTFGKLIDSQLRKKINKEISNDIFFVEINPKIPKYIKDSDLYYNKRHIKYVRESFSKKRLGFLHMCNFLTNINSYGKTGCLSKQLDKYDNLMFFDDDIYLKKKISFDLFDYLKYYPAVTGFADKLPKNQSSKDVTENLWNFYRNLVLKKKIKPKNKILRNSLKYEKDDILYKLKWSHGSFELFNMRKLKKKNLTNYLKEFNNYGGAYRHRWNNGYVLDLFLRTFFDKPIYNLNLLKKGFIEPKIQGADNFIYWGYKDSYNSVFFRLILKIRNFFRKLFF